MTGGSKKKSTHATMKRLSTILLSVAVLRGPSSLCRASSASPLAALKDVDYRYFVAGGTCAAISHGITTPIDVVKTRIQADPKVSVGSM